MISFGSVFLELVFGHVRELPGPGEEVFTDEFALSCGGAVTSATAAAAAGLRAGVCTVLGEDVGSLVVTEHCASAGVDLSPSVRVHRPASGITVVLNFEGDRGFVTHVPPAGQAEQPEITRWAQVLGEYRPSWCYLHASRGAPAFLAQARRLGCKIMLDTSLGDERDERDAIIECAGLADIFVPNGDELRRLTGCPTVETAVAVAAKWGTQLVIKRGAAGALTAGQDGRITAISQGVADVSVRDLTGAGDHFAGALIAALLGGAELPEAVVAANAAGSQAVGRLGAVGEIGGAGMHLHLLSASQPPLAPPAAGRRQAGSPEGVKTIATALAAQQHSMEQGR